MISNKDQPIFDWVSHDLLSEHPKEFHAVYNYSTVVTHMYWIENSFIICNSIYNSSLIKELYDL